MDLLMTKLELAKLYGVSRPTFSKRIAGLGFEKGRKKFSAQEVEQIMKYLGPPKQDRVKDLKARAKTENQEHPMSENDEHDETLEEVLSLFEQLNATDQQLLLKLMRTWCTFRFTHS